ncbi:rRNA biogenesis protein rrp5 [Boothiomyces macroporosus]|uniref:rRNA biogenesis protein rrp5 n=1 Tax=Boothiomyces macroporosus TaxID=261099 RepID=A0AAD5XZX3_9FUNG|nr:rRNA biogenesis protein rrp5 [Boothiomyces macroporosus]
MKDFPRGGGQELTPLEVRDITDKAKKEDEEPQLKKRKKEKQVEVTKRVKTEESFSLSFKRLNIGMSIIGVIKEIGELDMTISLPNQLVGYVSIAEISSIITARVEELADDDDDDPELPNLNDFFSVGQPVICQIIALKSEKEGKKRIDLTLNPDQINAKITELVPGMTISGMVESEQDRGYVIATGIKGVSGFLKKASQDFHIGQILALNVLKLDNSKKTVFLTNEKQGEIKSKNLDISQITAGALFKVKVSEVLEHGLKVSFLGFTGTIDTFHLGLKDQFDLGSLYKKGKSFDCRVLYCDTDAKTISLSKLPHIVDLSNIEIPSNLDIGIIEQVKICRIDSNIGVLVKVGETLGYVHISKLSDERIEKIEKKFKVDSTYPGRVIGHSLCDNLVLFSLEQKVLNETFIRVDDIKVGSDIKGTVKKIESFGVIVSITDSINALCPTIHLSDAKLSQPEKLFKIGAKLKFKVLSVDLEQKKVVLTHKKSLMNMTEKPITSYNECKIGDSTVGVITSVKDYGCIVSFFNDVKALAPIAELSHTRIESVSDNFTVGQSIKCQVLTVNPKEKKLRVTFKTSKIQNPHLVKVGKVCSGKFLSANKDGIIVTLDDSANHATIPLSHLNDSPEVANKIHQMFLNSKSKKPIALPKIMITNVDSKRGQISATCKHLIITHAETNGFVSSFSDLSENKIFPGVVKNITEVLCFILIGQVTVVASIHNIADGFVSDISSYLKPGQTVLTNIIKIDASQHRAYVTLKASQLTPVAQVALSENQYLTSLFGGRNLMKNITGIASSWAEKVEIGSVVKTTVEQILPYGLAVKVGKIPGIVSVQNHKYAVGDQVDCQVLDVDINSKIVDLIVADNVQAKKHKECLTKGSKNIDAVVELVKEDYAVVKIPSFGGAIGFCLNHSINNSIKPVPRFKAQQKISVQVKTLINIEEGVSRMLVQPPKSDPVVLSTKTTGGKRELQNPVDPEYKTLDDFVIGKTITGKVQSVKSLQLNIRLADNLRGRVHISEIYDSIDDVKDKRRPLVQFKHGEEISAVIIGYHDAKTHKFLPITHRNSSTQTVVELSLRPSILKQFEEDGLITIQNIETGTPYIGFVNKIEATAIWLQVSPGVLGRVDALMVSKDLEVLNNLQDHFQEGQAVTCFVVSKNVEKGQVDLSMLEDCSVEDEIEVGEVVCGRIQKLNANNGATVFLRSNTFGKLHITEFSDEFIEAPTSKYSEGDHIKALVVSKTNGVVNLTTKESALADPEKYLEDGIAIKVGDIVSGYVRSISDKGCFVSLSHAVHARVKISELSDEFVKEWKDLYKVGQLVQGKILSINSSNNQVELSLKKSNLVPGSARVGFEAIKPKTVMNGIVKKIESFGIFIILEGTNNISGLCHSSEVSDNPVKDVSKLYAVGDPVQVYILKVDPEKKKVSLSLKASRFEDQMTVDPSDDEESQASAQEESEVDKEELEEDDGDEDYEDVESNVKDIDQVDSDDEMEIEKDNSTTAASLMPKPSLSLEGFSWDAPVTAPVYSDSDEESEDEEEAKPKSRKDKKREKEEAERRIAQEEEALLDGDKEPELPEDFERLLLGSPNNSYLWIKYMALQLELAETEKARQVAERALKTINFREEQERFNIFIAFINLENKFGTPESVKAIFDRACQMSDPKKVHIQMAQIYETNEQIGAAEELHKKMIKKFNQSCKIWLGFVAFYIRQNKPEEAKSILKRSLQSLPKRKHLKMLSKVGHVEFKHGQPERGRTIMEGLLTSYPKKADLWSIYLDMEIKEGDLDICRRLFERALLVKWSTKKMKFFFKKYLEFEKKKGTPEGVNHVKEIAVRYVETLK